MSVSLDLKQMLLTLQQDISQIQTEMIEHVRDLPPGGYEPPKVDVNIAFKVLVWLERNHVGRKYAIKNGVLAAILGFKDVGSNGHRGHDNSNELTQAVQWLRRAAGVPVCGDVSGYFLPETIADIAPTAVHDLRCSLKYTRNANDLVTAAEKHFKVTL